MGKKTKIVKEEVVPKRWESIVIDTLLKGENVVIPGFGHLELKKLPERSCVLYKALIPNRSFTPAFSENSEGTDSSSDLYNYISQPLKSGNVVSIPQLGIFRPMSKGDGTVRISYVMSAFLRDLLNNNVEGKAAELELEKADEIPGVVLEPEIQLEPEVETDVIPDEDSEIEKEYLEKTVRDVKEYIPILENITTEKSAKASVSAVKEEFVIQEEEENYVNKPKKKKIILLATIAVVIIIIAVIFFGIFRAKGDDKGKEPLSVYQSESVNLPYLAKECYGNSVFWVYIYDANKEKLKSPINIPRGIALEIPDLSEYDVDINDSLEIRRAILRAELILNR